MQYIGYAKSTWKDSSENHAIIHAFLIDLKYVVKTWNGFNHKDDIAYLVQEIERQSKLNAGKQVV